MSQKVAAALSARKINVIVHGPTIGDRITYRILAKGGVAFSGNEILLLRTQGFNYAGLHNAFEAAAAPARAANNGVLPEDFIPPGWEVVDNNDPNDQHNTAADTFVNAVVGGMDGTDADKHDRKGYLIGLVVTAVDNLLRDDGDEVSFANWTESVLDGHG